MKHLFLPYELAVIAKEKGFDERCFTYYYKGEIQSISVLPFESEDKVIAPLYQQAIDWLEEKHRIFIMPYPRDGWCYLIQGIDGTISCSGISKHGEKFESKKESIHKAIEEAFKLI